MSKPMNPKPPPLTAMFFGSVFGMAVVKLEIDCEQTLNLISYYHKNQISSFTPKPRPPPLMT